MRPRSADDFATIRARMDELRGRPWEEGPSEPTPVERVRDALRALAARRGNGASMRLLRHWKATRVSDLAPEHYSRVVTEADSIP
jgi:hypothetical protein